MKTYKGKYKKAANGLQSVAVPEQGSETGVLSSAVNGASMGAQIPGLGPFGAIAGAAAGVGLGFLQKRDQDAAHAKAVARNKYVDMNDRVSATDSSIDQKAQVFRAGGNVVVNGKPKYRRADGKVVKRGLWSNTYLSKKEDGEAKVSKGTKIIEIEGKGTPEIHTDKNFNIKNLGTTPHTKGGNKVEASEGDIVFNTQNSLAKYNKIASAISAGDKATLTKEKNRLPEDSGDKNQDGNGGVKKPTKSIANPAWNYELPKAPVASYAPNSATQAMRRLSTAPFAVGKNIANGLSNANAQRDKDRRAQYEQSRRTEYSPIRADLDKQYLAKNAEYDAANKPSASTTKPTPTTATPAAVKPTYKSPTPVNDFFSKGVKSQVPTAGVKPKGVAVAGKKIDVAPPKVATPIAAPTVPGPKTGNFALESQDGNNVPLAKTTAEPTTPVTNTVTPPDPNQPTVTTVGEGVTKTGNAPANGTTPTSGLANNLAQFTGVANNLIQGIKPERPINQQYFDPQLNKYTDRSESLRQQSTSAENIQNANARNVSGGNAGNMRANQDQAALGNLTRQGAINEQEMTRRDAVDVQNNGLKNQASQYNLQRKDMYQGQIDGTRAAKQAYTDQAAVDLGKIGNVREQQAYQKSRDAKSDEMQMAGYRSISGGQHYRNLDGTAGFNPLGSTGGGYLGGRNTNRNRTGTSAIGLGGMYPDYYNKDGSIIDKEAKGVKAVKVKSKYKMK